MNLRFTFMYFSIICVLSGFLRFFFCLRCVRLIYSEFVDEQKNNNNYIWRYGMENLQFTNGRADLHFWFYEIKIACYMTIKNKRKLNNIHMVKLKFFEWVFRHSCYVFFLNVLAPLNVHFCSTFIQYPRNYTHFLPNHPPSPYSEWKKNCREIWFAFIVVVGLLVVLSEEETDWKSFFFSFFNNLVILFGWVDVFDGKH